MNQMLVDVAEYRRNRAAAAQGLAREFGLTTREEIALDFGDLDLDETEPYDALDDAFNPYPPVIA